MRSLHKLSVGLIVALAACSRVGTPAAPTPIERAAEATAVMKRSVLSGVATLAGRRLRVTLLIETDERGRGPAHLEIPELPLVADGTATWRGESLELDLHYDGSCPGDLRIRAEGAVDEGRLEGTLSAKDCTGEESGRVVLETSTRPPDGGPTPPRVESAAGGV